MKKTRQQEIEELQEKVFGKGSPSRKIITSSSEMMEEARRIEKDIDRIDASFQSVLQNNLDIIKKQNEEVTKMMDLDSFSEEIYKDFKIEKELDFTSLEDTLTSKVYSQEEAIQKMMIALQRPYTYNMNLSCLNSILLLGPKGCGKHTLLKAIGSVSWIDLSLYKSNDDEKTFLQDIFQAIQSKTKIIAFENVEACHPAYLSMISSFFKDGKLELKKRYVQSKNQLQETNNTFVSQAIQALEAKDQYLVLLSSLKKSKITGLLGMEFMNSLSDIIEMKPLDSIAIEMMIPLEMDQIQKEMNCTVNPNVKDYYLKEYNPVDGAYSLKNCTKNILLSLSQYKLEHKDASIELVYEDVLKVKEDDKELSSYISKVNSTSIDEIKKELDEIVGLKEVKEYVLSLEDHFKIQKIREQKGLKTGSVSKHMIFTGNPGTGKTTIARLISKYLQSIGILSSGQLIEVSRQDLVGKYVGHTAPLTNSVIQSALGGVLFIDEAYSLYRGKDDSFGLECIDTIVKGIEDYRDDLIVILAGYKKEMDEFLESNSGLKSRFPNIIDFPDYTAQELVDISHSVAKSKDYFINEECNDALYAYYDKIQSDCNNKSGNGRLARNKVEEAILKQSSRLLKNMDCDFQELILEDFVLE